MEQPVVVLAGVEPIVRRALLAALVTRAEIRDCPIEEAVAEARARAATTDCRRAVRVAPGSTLFTVIPRRATSSESVLAQLATAPRTVLDTPSPLIGWRTEVDTTLIMRP